MSLFIANYSNPGLNQNYILIFLECFYLSVASVWFRDINSFFFYEVKYFPPCFCPSPQYSGICPVCKPISSGDLVRFSHFQTCRLDLLNYSSLVSSSCLQDTSMRFLGDNSCFFLGLVCISLKKFMLFFPNNFYLVLHLGCWILIPKCLSGVLSSLGLCCAKQTLTCWWECIRDHQDGWGARCMMKEDRQMYFIVKAKIHIKLKEELSVLLSLLMEEYREDWALFSAVCWDRIRDNGQT